MPAYRIELHPETDSITIVAWNTSRRRDGRNNGQPIEQRIGDPQFADSFYKLDANAVDVLADEMKEAVRLMRMMPRMRIIRVEDNPMREDPLRGRAIAVDVDVPRFDDIIDDPFDNPNE